VIQIALKNGVSIESTLAMVKEARSRGLKAPVMLMGYYNPLLSYGEERLLKDCQTSGVNGFIVVDLPPEEAISFRKLCSKGR
jgi:tryptophan synthase